MLDRIHGGSDVNPRHAQLVSRALRLFLGAHGERRHQIGHHREATACIARPPGFHRRIHGKDARLERDLVEPANHIVNALGAVEHAGHRLHGGIGATAPFEHGGIGLLGRFHRLRRGECRRLEPRIDLLNRGGGLLQARRRTLCAAGDVVCRLGDFVRAAVNIAGARFHRGEQLAKVAQRLVEAALHRRVGCGEILRDIDGKVAIGEPPELADHRLGDHRVDFRIAFQLLVHDDLLLGVFPKREHRLGHAPDTVGEVGELDRRVEVTSGKPLHAPDGRDIGSGDRLAEKMRHDEANCGRNDADQ
ncbi:hypothetical protein D9M73_109760 [compost metagenome]